MKVFGQNTSPLEPAEKKISTPSGRRLSAITGSRAARTPPRPALLGIGFSDAERSSIRSVLRGKSGQTYTTAWSDGEILSGDTDSGTWRGNWYAAMRTEWRKVMVIVAIIIAAIIALSLGIAFGLQKTKNSNSNSSSETDASNNSQASDTSQAVKSGSSSTVSANFPLGTYSFTTFLDTVTTDCTSNTDTWTCAPYVIYNTNKDNANETFSWMITGSAGNRKISSVNDATSSSIEFEDVDLELYSEGQDSERYRFQITTDKKVVPSPSISDDDSSTVCYFNSTTFTGYLYTKMEKDYQISDEPSDPWPYAVRVEQSIAGGENVPNCYETVDGRITKQITDGLDAMDASTLCSCLYRNYLTK